MPDVSKEVINEAEDNEVETSDLNLFFRLRIKLPVAKIDPVLTSTACLELQLTVVPRTSSSVVDRLDPFVEMVSQPPH